MAMSNNSSGHQTGEIATRENHDNHDAPVHYFDADGKPLPSVLETHRPDRTLTENQTEKYNERSEKQEMAHLINMNAVLAEELTSLRNWKVVMEEKARVMEKDIEKWELEASIMEQEWAQWLEEKQALASHKKTPKLALSESKISESEINLFKLEMEQLSDEQQKLITEKDNLEAQIYPSQGHYTEQLLHNKSVENQLVCILDAYAAADFQVCVTSKIIENLQVEVERLTEINQRSEKHLEESLQRISSLKEHAKDMVFQHQELEALVQNIESTLETSRGAHQTTLLSLEQEKKSNASLVNALEAAHSKSRSLEKNMESLQTSFLTAQGETLKYQQQVSHLKSKASSLLGENTSFEGAKPIMFLEGKKINSTSEGVKTDAEQDVAEYQKQVEFLESALTCAKQEAICFSQKIVQLQAELGMVRECLYKKTTLAPYMLPIATVSAGALALLGMVAFFKQSRNQ